MKTRKHSLLTAWILALLVLSFAVSGFAGAETILIAQDDYAYYDVEISYPNTFPYETTETTGFVFSDTMLMQDAHGLSTDMAKASAAMAMAAYNQSHSTAALKQMGFEVVGGTASYTTVDNLTIDNCNHVAYLIGRKVIGDSIAYCVPVKGTTGNAEWFSDFDLGTSGEHKGFYEAAREVQAELHALLAADNYDAGHTIIWTTGHSRGAAVANIIAGELTAAGGYASSNHIFSYNFACPSFSKYTAAYDNIYNFNGAGDLIPALPLEDWGYRNYGHNILLHRTEDANFLRRFEEEISSSFSSAQNTGGYVTLIKQVAAEEEDFHEPTIRLALLVAAWGLGGNTDASLEEVLEYSGYHAGDLLWDIITLKDTIEGIQQSFVDISTDLAYLITFCNEYSSAAYMTQEEFDLFLEEHSDIIPAIAQYAGFAIEAPDDFARAASMITSINADVDSSGDVINNILSLYFASDGNIAEGVGDGHTQAGYVLAINSMYYGYKGWYGSDSAPNTLPENITTVGAHCFRDCANITDPAFHDQLKAFGTYAYHGCTGIETLCIPDNVVYIGKVAFGDCTSLRDLTMPVEMAKAELFTSKCAVERIHYTAASDGVMPDREPDYDFNNPGYYVEHTLEYFSRQTLTEVVFDEGVTHIGAYTFYDEYDSGVLASVSLPSTLESVGDYAFYNLPAFTQSLILPEGFTTLGAYSFARCGISDLFLPAGVIDIPAYCFSDCTGIETLIIPNTVLTMSDYAFWGCHGVKHLEIPVELSRMYVLDSAIIEDVRYTANSTGIMPDRIQDKWSNDTAWTLEGKSANTLKSVEFTEGVTRIGMNAFDAGVDEGHLTSLILPGTLKSIGDYAFYSQSSLAIDLVLPEGVTEIGEYCFYNCGLTGITLPESLLNYPTGCFEGCIAAKEINFANVPMQIGDYAFKNCDSVTNLVIPTNTLSLGQNCFELMDSLQTLTIPVELAAPYTVTTGYAPVLETIRYTVGSTGIMPDREDGFPYMSTAEYSAQKSLKTVIFEEGVKHIGDRAFYSNQDECGLENITIPSTLESIGDYAFYSQKLLTEPIVLPDGFKQLGAHSFDLCSALTGITLPEGIEEIPDWCFHFCHELRFELPESLRRIGECAFEMCAVNDDGHLIIPRGIEYVGENAFLWCESLTEITLPVELDAPGAFNIKTIEQIHYTVGSTGIMPDRSNDDNAENNWFNYLEYKAENLIRVDFEEGVKRIGAYAYYNDRYYAALQEVALPSTLESIGDYAFYNRQSLQKIDFPASFSEIGSYAFGNCLSIAEITFDGPAPVIGENAFSIGWGNEIDAYYIPMQGGWTSDVLIDHGTPMHWISVGDFFSLNHESIALLISDQAFGGSVQLVFNFNDENVNADAVWTSDDAGIASVENGLITAAGEGSTIIRASYRDVNLQCEVEVWQNPAILRLPAMTKAIEADAFRDLPEIQAAALGDYVERIGENAFTGCDGLLFVNLPVSVTDIAESAFDGCGSLQIFCTEGSYGESYAIQQGIPYAYMP